MGYHAGQSSFGRFEAVDQTSPCPEMVDVAVNPSRVPDPTRLALRLLEWHARERRDLPWRDAPPGQRDPYRVWVAEIMAQQTRLDTVRPYFERWMARFPTVHHLAEAHPQEVLKLWEGLGYYARARNLHRAAQQVVEEYGGSLPMDRRALLALPGIGPYTAGAILSLAFGMAEPLVDGNVRRVLTRLWDVDRPVEDTATQRELWQRAQALVDAAPQGQAGALNEALMELGAILCTPRRPRCSVCPVQNDCLAAARGTQERRPVQRPRRRVPHLHVTAAVLWQGEPYRSPLLLAQRPLDGMLGGLWEFPGGKMEATDPDLPACLRREIREELGIDIRVGEPVTTVKHAYSHFRITLHAFHAFPVRGEPQALGCQDWRWLSLEELDAYPLSAADQKVLQALRRHAPTPPDAP